MIDKRRKVLDTDKTDNFEQISEWLSIYHSTDNEVEKEKAKTLIVGKMIPIVNRIARTIARRATDPIEDMVQAGFIGLLKAIDKYSKDKNDNFRIYAGYLIIGEMKHDLRDKLSMIRVPRHIQELTIRINNFTRDLTLEEIRELTTDEVATALNVSTKAVDYALEVDRRSSTISLEDLYSSNSESLDYEEVLTNENYKEREQFEDARIIFEDVINKLEPEERVLIDMYYKQDMSQKEIANALVISPVNVSRKLKQAFDSLAKLVIEEKKLKHDELDYGK